MPLLLSFEHMCIIREHCICASGTFSPQPQPSRDGSLLVRSDDLKTCQQLKRDLRPNKPNPGANMTTTVLELIANLKHYPDLTVVTITDIYDQEFVIVDFKSETNTLNIIIGEVVYEEESEDE
jgi:hypothetical protein